MKRIFKWIGIAVGGLIVLLLVAVAVMGLIANRNLNRVHTPTASSITIPSDAAALARGKHVVHSVATCISCHGPDLAGKVFIDGMPMGVVVAGNLTAGNGGIGATYTDEDWINALRYGVGADGKALLPMMPADSFHALSDDDLGAAIAYLKSLPAVDSVVPETALAFPGQIIMGVLAQGDFPANYLLESAAPPSTTPSGTTVEHGAYLVAVGSCRHCHGKELNGGQADPEAPIGPNLTTGGTLATWTKEDFVHAMRAGIRPDGSTIDPFMPWPNFGQMSDEELESIWLYLQSLEPLDNALPSG